MGEDRKRNIAGEKKKSDGTRPKWFREEMEKSAKATEKVRQRDTTYARTREAPIKDSSHLGVDLVSRYVLDYGGGGYESYAVPPDAALCCLPRGVAFGEWGRRGRYFPNGENKSTAGHPERESRSAVSRFLSGRGGPRDARVR